MVRIHSRAKQSNSGPSANLDHLRAIAVLLVVFSHVAELLKLRYPAFAHLPPYYFNFGRVGVLLFFVHTSTVLCASMDRLNLQGWALFESFMIRRCMRIYPLAIITVVLLAVFRIPSMPWLNDGGVRSLGEFLSNLALTQNLTYSRPLLGPLWSLPVEVQMYCMLPLVFLRARGQPLIVLGMFIAAASIAQAPIPGRLSVLEFVPCFLAGVLAHTLRDTRPVLSAKLWAPMLLAVTAAYTIWAPLPESGVMEPGWLLCMVVGASMPLFRDSRAQAPNAVAHVVAKYSYGVYLFHCIGLWVGCFVLAALPSFAQWAVALAIVVVGSVGLFHLLEQPAVKLGARIARARESRQIAAEGIG